MGYMCACVCVGLVDIVYQYYSQFNLFLKSNVFQHKSSTDFGENISNNEGGQGFTIKARV